MDNKSFQQIVKELRNGEVGREEAKVLLNTLKKRQGEFSYTPTILKNCSLRANSTDIAVIGMAGQFSDALDVHTFWQNLIEGRDGVHELPAHYLEQNFCLTAQNQSHPYKWGGILEERDCFDPLFFNISPREAVSMNPHQRLVLQESWKALEDAGYNPKKLADLPVSMYIGAEPTGYAHETFTGLSDAIIASRLSYFLDLKGPAIVVNTGCSSSGVAIHLACESLRNGESILALAGGVFAKLDQALLSRLSEIGMLSPAGKCRTFDESGEGTVLSEGLGIVVLKRLDEAIADGDHIYGVIAGTGINQDGASNGITAPNGVAQEKLITSVYKRFHINPEEITYIEAHGTGTKLGDPVEANALVRAFKQFTDKKGFCVIGSVKSNIGHTSAAAGVIGLIKILLSLRHRQLPGLIHFQKLNPLIEFDGSPFYVNTQRSEWRTEHGRPLMAALNSFGHSGTNAHLVIKEFIPPDDRSLPSLTYQNKNISVLVPLSAKNKERLQEYATKLLKFLKESLSDETDSLNDAHVYRELQNTLENKIRNLLSAILQVKEGELEIEQTLNDYGVEPIHLISLQIQFQEEFHIQMEFRELLAGNSISLMARCLLENHFKAIEAYYFDIRKEQPVSKEITSKRRENENSPVDIAAIAYTLQTGREAMEERVIFLVKDIPELIDRLENFVTGKEVIERCWRGSVNQDNQWVRLIASFEEVQELTARWIAKGAAERIGLLWTQGFEINWELLNGETKPQRISLPTYPFAKERYWMPSTPLVNLSSMPARDNSLLVYSGIRAAASKRPEMLILHKEWAPDNLNPRDTKLQNRRLVIIVNGTSFLNVVKELKNYPEVRWILIRERCGHPLDTSPTFEMDFWDSDEGRLAAEEIWRGHGPVDGIIDLSDIRTEPLRTEEPAWGRISFLQTLIKYQMQAKMAILHFTSGMIPYGHPRPTMSGALMAGFIRVLGAEHARIISRTVDLDFGCEGAAEILKIAVAELNSDVEKPEAYYRSGIRHSPLLCPVPLEESSAAGFLGRHRIVSDKTYLITGGTGSLGIITANELVRQGARKLALTGATLLPEQKEWDNILASSETPLALREKIRRIRMLEESGVSILLYTGPLTEHDHFGNFLTRVRREQGPIGGVIHCAGYVSYDNPSLIHKGREQMAAVFEPKVSGLNVLAGLIGEDNPAFFVLYSSVSAVIPRLGAGIGDYAAANYYMDAFALHHSKMGWKGIVSIQWPCWKDTGMGEVTSARYHELGFIAHEPADGLKLLQSSLSGSEACLLSAIVDGVRFNPDILFSGTGPSNILGEVRNGAGGVCQEKDLFAPTCEMIANIFAQELMIDRNRINGDTQFGEYGVDSILIAQIVRKLEEVFDEPLEPSLILEYPTLNRLGAHLAEKCASTVSGRLSSIDQKTEVAVVNEAKASIHPWKFSITEQKNGITARPSFSKKVAVIGMAGNFPGAANTGEFWENLRLGRSSISEIPDSRWDVNLLFSPSPEPGKIYSKWGGFIKDIELFDAAYFGISETDAPHVDPLIRQMLECGVQALCDAGYEQKELSGRRVAVYVGSGTSNYGERIIIPHKGTVTGVNQNFIGAHLAHFFNWHGPNVVIDTACSSSLVAVHLACQALITGDCEVALAGGVDLLLDETPYLRLSAAQALSPEGKCFTFDIKANGFVPGEGCGAVILKPLDAALKDGDRIYAVVESTAVNNDGHTMGITTPNLQAQEDVISEAITRGNVEADTLSYVETHGTGTMIGDPIELRALTNVFRRFTEDRQFCAVGSVKTNIGHLLLASGMVSFIKTVLALHHRMIPPTLNCKEPNPRFEFANSPFFPALELRPWTPRHGVRRAGVSSFGFGGTNCHTIICDLESVHPESHYPRRSQRPSVEFRRKRYWVERDAKLPRGDSTGMTKGKNPSPEMLVLEEV